MTDRLKIELDDVRKRFGIEPDAEDVIKLYEACKLCDAPFQHTNLSLIGFGVEVGGVMLYPLTIGASIWLDEYAVNWWGTSNTLMHWALVFAFVKGRERGVFADLTDEKTAHAAIRKICLNFACNEKELAKAIDVLTGQKEAEPVGENTHGDPDWLKVVAELEITSGIDADMWLWGKSASYTQRAYMEHRRNLNLAAGNRLETIDALDMALTALALAKKSIWKKHNGQ